MAKHHYIIAGLALAGLTACTAPAPTVVGPEPVADKYGNALYCPDPYVLQGNECVLVDPAVQTGTGTGPAPAAPAAPGTGNNGNQNGNQNSNQNQENNQNQEGNQNQQGNQNQAQTG